MHKIAAFITGSIGFFIVAGAGGGIECDTMGWGQGLAYIVLGLAIMWASAMWARLTR